MRVQLGTALTMGALRPTHCRHGRTDDRREHQRRYCRCRAQARPHRREVEGGEHAIAVEYLRRQSLSF